MRRLLEAEIAAVINRRQALIGALGVVDAVIAMAARHQGRDHHFRADFQRLAHEVFREFRTDLDQHPADLMAKRERPGQWLGPMALEDVEVSSADAAGSDLDQRALLSDFRPGHAADDGLRARPVIGADANLFHRLFLRALCLMAL